MKSYPSTILTKLVADMTEASDGRARGVRTASTTRFGSLGPPWQWECETALHKSQGCGRMFFETTKQPMSLLVYKILI